MNLTLPYVSRVTAIFSIALFVLVMAVPLTLSAQEGQPLSPYARVLALSIIDSATNDSEKARAIYDWVTHNIRYDADLINNPRSVEEHIALNETEIVLREKKGVCQGYANVLADLCQAAGIQAVVVVGHASQYGDDLDLEKPNHAWNAIKYEDQWHLVDATWGAGYLTDDDQRFVASPTDDYWNVDPAILVGTHLPEDPLWQLADHPKSLQHFFGPTAYAMPGLADFSYQDTLLHWEGLSRTGQKENTIRRQVAYNPSNASSLLDYAAYYVNHGYGLMEAQDQLGEKYEGQLAGHRDTLMYMIDAALHDFRQGEAICRSLPASAAERYQHKAEEYLTLIDGNQEAAAYNKALLYFDLGEEVVEWLEEERKNAAAMKAHDPNDLMGRLRQSRTEFDLARQAFLPLGVEDGDLAAEARRAGTVIAERFDYIDWSLTAMERSYFLYRTGLYTFLFGGWNVQR